MLIKIDIDLKSPVLRNYSRSTHLFLLIFSTELHFFILEYFCSSVALFFSFFLHFFIPFFINTSLSLNHRVSYFISTLCQWRNSDGHLYASALDFSHLLKPLTNQCVRNKLWILPTFGSATE